MSIFNHSFSDFIGDEHTFIGHFKGIFVCYGMIQLNMFFIVVNVNSIGVYVTIVAELNKLFKTISIEKPLVFHQITIR